MKIKHIVVAMLLLSSTLLAEEKNLNIVWQRIIESDSVSYVPNLLKINSEGKLLVVGGSFDFSDKTAPGQLLLWEYDLQGVQTRSDIVKTNISKAKRNLINFDSAGFLEMNNTLFFESKTLEGGFESELYSLDKKSKESKFSVNKLHKGFDLMLWPNLNNKVEKISLKKIATDGNNLYLLGTKSGRQSVIKKVGSNLEELSRKEIDLAEATNCTDMSISKSIGLTSCGYLINGIKSREPTVKIYLALHDFKGELLNVTSIDSKIWEPSSRFPQVSFLDNDMIAVVYNNSVNRQSSSIYCDIFDLTLKLVQKIEIYRSENYFSNFGIKKIPNGFIVANYVESFQPHILINQYDLNGVNVGSIKIDNVSCYGSINILFDIYEQTLCIANTDHFMKKFTAENKPQTKTLITAVDLIN